MADASTNQWKLATIGLLIVGITVLITSLVIGRGTEVVPPEKIVQTEKEADTQVTNNEPEKKTKDAVKVATVPPASKPAPAPKPVYKAPPTSQSTPEPNIVYNSQPTNPPQPAYPPESVIQACNKYASEQVGSKTGEVVKGAGIGALLGAATGAAVGAIAGGGKGAAKGAGIGAIGGGVGGTLYGLNENQSNDARYQEAYASCMRMRGY